MSPRTRSFLFSLLALAVSAALSLALLEVGSRIAYGRYFGRAFSRRDVQGRLLQDRFAEATSPTDDDAQLETQLSALKNAEIPDSNVIIHPYYGFIVNPESPGMNRFGFFEQDPFTKRGDDRFVILILGGSFADQVFYLGKDTMAARLRSYDAFRDKEVEIVSVALGGYKQPQQMIILADLFLHGAQYDAVVLTIGSRKPRDLTVPVIVRSTSSEPEKISTMKHAAATTFKAVLMRHNHEIANAAKGSEPTNQ
jgi:hypothetical protein